MKKYFKAILFFILLSGLFHACEKTPAPTATITISKDGNIVEFQVESANAESFEWDFGDGSSVSTEQNPVHIFREFGKEYTVTLTVTGPGGQTVMTETIVIRSITHMEILTGGKGNQDGRRWRLNSGAGAFRANADVSLTVVQSLPPGYLNQIGFTDAYFDEFVFRYNGDYSIIPQGEGVIAGLSYCTAKNIPNTPPGQEAVSAGLTLMNSFTHPEGLKFGFQESRNLAIPVSDGNSSASVIIPDVMTLSFSKGGFLGLNNWVTDCVITDLTETSMKVAFFTSDIPHDSQYAGITNGVLIFTFELVE